MADTKISGLTALTGANTASGDLLTIVDVSDTTMAATGTNKKITLTELQSAPVSAGTANGVLYLNGSKVATAGSALTFAGSQLTVDGAYALSGDDFVYSYGGGTSGQRRAGFYLDGTNGQIRHYIGGSEGMRLTSIGLGIGTSSPGTRLHVKGATNQVSIKLENPQARTFQILSNGSTGGGGAPTGSFAIYDETAGADRLTLDASGNLGLGVTPSAWGSGWRGLQNGSAAFASASGYAAIGNNWYTSASADTYITSNFATRYYQNAGQHIWNTAASGTAGNAITFTQAMTLGSNGYLSVGDTSTNYPLTIKANGTNSYAPMLTINPATGTNASYIYMNNGGSGGFFVGRADSTGQHSGTAISAYDSFIWNTGVQNIVFGTNNTERARIDSSGNFLFSRTDTSAATRGSYFNSVGAWVSGAPNGTAVAYFVCTSNSADVGSITVSTTATAYNTSSDYRLKNIDGPLTDSGAFIDALKPKIGTWKADGSKFVGFLAHEVQEVSPNSVVGQKDAIDENGKPIMQAMEYGSAEFIANIVAELQSLRKRLADAGIA